MLKRVLCSIALPLLIITLVGYSPYASALGAPASGGIDLMLVIDNSCSMFAIEAVLPGTCTDTGNDPKALRITSADLFISKLGFAETNAADYQLGAINLGGNEHVFAQLQPLDHARNALISSISNPQPNTSTRIVPALQVAIDELHSARRRKGNLPAMVILTDGGPWPEEGQGQADIEQVLRQAHDIRMFMLLLVPPGGVSTTYARYVALWQDLQLHYPNLSVYTVGSADNLLATYNTIAAQLGQAISLGPITLGPGQTHTFLVSSYTRRIIVTAVGDQGQPTAQMQLFDPNRQQVQIGESGVDHFDGGGQPIEILSVAAPRLARNLLDAFWTIQANEAVSLFVDTQGTYRVNIIAPQVNQVGSTDEYRLPDPQPIKPMNLRLSLLDSDSMPVLTPQELQAEVVDDDGSRALLALPPGLAPDASGVYTLSLDLASVFASPPTRPAPLTIDISAGASDVATGGFVPVARARLRVVADPAAPITPTVPTDTPTVPTDTPTVPPPPCDGLATVQRAFWLPVSPPTALCWWLDIARKIAIGMFILIIFLLLKMISAIISRSIPLPKGFISLSNKDGTFNDPIPIPIHGKRRQERYTIRDSYGRILIYERGIRPVWVITTRRGQTVVTMRKPKQEQLSRRSPQMMVRDQRTRLLHGLNEDQLKVAVEANNARP